MLAFSWQSALAASDDSVIEEIIVTGSYIKRNAANSPSPLSVITSADIEDLGAADISEIIQAMPWASGSQTRASTFQGEGADGRNTINLRNLGHGATLPLVNGKRHVPSWYNGRGNASTNINNLVPNIAIERIEIVKDGASALYGSDAVAGVVNFITKQDFEGFDASYQFTTSDETNNGDTHNIELIWGVQGDRGGIVVSASLLDREEINIEDNYDRYGATTISSTGQPGRLQPISGQQVIWAANGLRPGQLTDRAIDGIGAAGNSGNLPMAADGSVWGQADVNCNDSAALEQGGPLGHLWNIPLPGITDNFEIASRCVYDYGSFFSIQGEEKMRKIHVNGHYDLTEQVELYFEFSNNESEFLRLNSLNPNAPALPIPTGTSFIDSAGVTQFAPNPGSVEDAFRRGIEPITYANITRMMGGTRNTPASLRPISTFTNSDRKDTRYVVGATWDFELGDREWSLDASYVASNHNSATTQVQDTLSTHMELALNGYGGPNCDSTFGTPGEGNTAFNMSGGNFDAGQCYFFNPFGNGVFDRTGQLGQTNLELVNPPELYNWLLGKASSDVEYKQRVIDIVASGELFDLGDETVGLAVGFQQRRDKGETFLDSSLTSDNLDFVFGARPWSGKLTTTAYFAEVRVPFGPRFEVNVAVRYEDFDEIGEDTTDPKVTMMWQPIDSLSLRATWGTSFRVPSLLQSFGTLTTVANQADLVGGTTFKPSLTVGNPSLTPESAENWGIGFSYAPVDNFLEGLQIDVDYFTYEYEDIITREASATLLSQDNAALAAYALANLGGSCATNEQCYIDAVNAGVGNRAKVIRNTQAILLRILPDFANANGADISGIDLNTSYTFDTGIG
ncbi:MAG: TonB-dependent receptor, partial [Gammaproteobacteria bacterium]|nr:TonB-dependent receptor [Gammaproteobacteria bacterium]